jgi:hypothetical protein
MRRKSYTKKRKHYKKGGTYQTYKQALSPRKSHEKPIPPPLRATSAAKLIQTAISKHLDDKYSECAICLHHIIDSDEQVKLSCNPDRRTGHTFHKHCVDEIKTSGLRACPMCRAIVPELSNIEIIRKAIKQNVEYRNIPPELASPENIEHITTILNDIINSRIGEGELPPNMTQLAINNWIRKFSIRAKHLFAKIYAEIQTLKGTIYTKKSVREGNPELLKRIGKEKKDPIKKLWLSIFGAYFAIQFYFPAVPESLTTEITNLGNHIIQHILHGMSEDITQQRMDKIVSDYVVELTVFD